MSEESLWQKSDRALREELAHRERQGSHEFPVVVVLEVPPVVARPGDPAAWRTRFEELSRGVVEQLERLGGRDIELLWIGSSIAARAPRAALLALAERGDVRQLVLNSDRNAMLGR
jgi:hypothetical protein